MNSFKGKSFLSLLDFSQEQIYYLLSLSADLKAKKRAGIRGNSLAGKNIALLFEKASTRTRSAFTVACVDEGGHAEFLSKEDIHFRGKEDVKDSARALGRMYDGIEYRGFSHDIVEELAKWAGVPVWNGLTDIDHPTQALADLMTLQENFTFKLKGLNVTYVGDGRNNVSNALMIGCVKMGVNFTIGAPKELFPDAGLLEKCRVIAEDSGSVIKITDNQLDAVKGADAIYTDVWVSMGEEDQKAIRYKLLEPWRVDTKLMQSSGKTDTIFMHCLPAIKGCEVTEEVFESKASKVFDEAENRMHTIKAVMVATAGV